jgi:hypothetical protein
VQRCVVDFFCLNKRKLIADLYQNLRVTHKPNTFLNITNQ